MTTETPRELAASAPQVGSAVSLPIEGMTCASCIARVERALKAVPSVETATVNLATERANLTFSGSPDFQTVVRAIERAGYTVPTETTDLVIAAMTCASCVGRVEKALGRVPGVLSASVNLVTEHAVVHSLGGTVSIAGLVAAVEKAGYHAQVAVADTAATAEREAARRDREARALRGSLLISALLTLPIFFLEMGSHLIPGVHDWILATIGQRAGWYLEFGLATIVLCWPGYRFFRKGVPALLRGAPDMNSLVAIGTAAAYGYSIVATFLPGILPAGTANVYYEAAALIVTLILLGRTLEARAKGRTSEAIKRLMHLQPKTARVRRGAEIIEIALDELRLEDVVFVRPGERIAVDGEVIEGSSYVDESMISGEPMPVLKSAGSNVVGGTINKSGAFSFRTTRIGAETVLARIIKLVEQAQGAKLPIQGLVDKVTMWFVPAVMLAAALTFSVWLVVGPSPALTFALVNAVAVLIIACPCAMGLATPTSIMVGIGRAAELGILFRKGEALQALRDVTVIALDKTGTLTEGRPELTDLETVLGFDSHDVLGLVAAVEARSEHPIGEALAAAAKRQHIAIADVTAFEATPGLGVSGRVDGRNVHVGADRFMIALGHDLARLLPTSERLAREGKTPLYAAIDGRLAAVIAVADPIKETTPKAIQALRDLGLTVAMITGDNAGTAAVIARQLGIDKFVAEVLPDGKVAALQTFRSGGARVGFVGDGINDAPALAAADVGLAIGTGTDVAIETADVVLMSGDLCGVANAIALSNATMRNIQQNLFWAFGYNVVLIPVAAGALYPVNGVLLSPIIAAAAMALSSVFVLGNALRLRSFKLRSHDESHAASEQNNRFVPAS